jgi:hypothetical protein
VRTPKETALDVLKGARGDDLERAQMAFGNMSDQELDTVYGSSGKTCREILAGYQKNREEINAAIRFVSLL